MMRIARWTTLVLMGGVMSMASAATHGAAFDTFDYADGALSGQSGGSGWAGAWAKRGGTNTDAVSGGVASVTGDNSAVFNNQGATYRTLSETLGDDESQVWLSMDMMRLSGGVDASFIVMDLRLNAPPATGDPGGNLVIGEGWTGIVATDDKWGMQRTAPFVNVASSSSSDAWTNLVVQLDYDNNLTNLWINPDKNNPLPGTPDVFIAGVPVTFNTILLRSGGATGAHTLGIDNLYIGASASDVGFIPEPASLALVAIGGAMLLSRRRDA